MAVASGAAPTAESGARGTSAVVKPGVHMPALDGTRGMGIFLVILHHYTSFCGMGVFHFVWPAMDQFFVLSGFLITMNLRRAKERPHYFRNFYARRVLRIFPLHYLFL